MKFNSLSFLQLSVCVSLINAVIIRDYNMVNFKEFATYKDFADVFLNLDKNTVNQNLFVGIAKPECAHQLESPAFRGAQRHGGGNVVGAVTVPFEDFKLQLEGDNCAEIFFYRIGDDILHPTSTTTEFNHADLNSWSADLMRIDGAVFTNHFDYDVELFWHEESNEPVSNGIISPGNSFAISTFLGHIFSAHRVVPYEDLSDEDRLVDPGYRNIVDFMVVNGESYAFSPLNRLETCEIVPGSSTVYASEGQVRSCDDMKVRLIEFTHTVWYEKRLALNFVQPQLVRAVTHNGFEHRQLPAETYQWLKAWYNREQLQQEITESAVGPCMNQHVAPSAVTHLTPGNKDRLSRELRSHLEGWYGGDLFMTSIYGIRKYNNGSVLRMHVDTVGTHVVSAIINVDQEVDEDWPLLILDHDDVEHNIIMKPGDMVFYESAKLLHGRPQAFKGKHYDNIFIHYKPTEGWDYSWL